MRSAEPTAATTNAPMASSTMVPPEGVSAAYDTATPPTAQATPIATAQASDDRKLWPRSWAAALGTIIKALMSSKPTIRIDTTTVTAVRTASARLRARTGRPADRAYSSSLATANSRQRRTPTTRRMTTVSTPKTHRSAAVTVVIAPKRYAVRLAGVPLGDFPMMTTLAAMPP